ncbi:DnaA regulatory inactivator Hda [Acidihalobacter yilgarnensis]|uniref:DnaA regulatory inactivator Hda n=1 Tax=Acidihalobacter yilgarnensis TaxID=2819280 RepID=A0A1D8IQ95_9GAMM|nr:DnaA regulatory inactivator Hda [Acidihalobacter yilgarnensis]AOU98605.1 DnaA regulatory inactivator Hda [Acidihalobacter yilgarnensis]
MADQLALNLRLRAETTLAAYIPSSEQGEIPETVGALVAGRVEVPQLYLWGGPGTGKTHLAQAACHEAGAQGLSAAYLPLAELSAVGPVVLEGLSTVRVLAIDDLEQVWTRPEWQRALFGLINEVREREGRLLFTATARPDAEQVTLADLRSRLLWGPVFHLRPLDEPRLRRMLQLGARTRGFPLGESETEYLLRHAARDPESLMTLLDRLDAASLKARRRVTVPLIRAVLDQD